MSNLFKVCKPMKKTLCMSLLAIGLVLASQDRASAWVNSKFGVGLNWSWQSGGNNVFWGMFNGAQAPAYDPFSGNVMPGNSVAPGGYGPQFSSTGTASPTPTATLTPPPVTTEPAAITPAPQQTRGATTTTNYQSVSYPNNSIQYSTPNYYYGYSGYSMPVYWYGSR